MNENLNFHVSRGSKNTMTKNKRLAVVVKTALPLILVFLLVVSLGSKTPEKDNFDHFNLEVASLDDAYDENELGLLLDPAKYIEKANPALASSVTTSRKKLTGKFLHITDPHPDPYYQEDGLIETACHKVPAHSDMEQDGLWEFISGRSKKRAVGSKFGDPMLGCDSPTILVTETFKYLEDNFKGEVDFVVWTGDNSRHDNDRKIPRTSFEIMGNNMDLSKRLAMHFDDIPIVPTIGNNDIYPHNLMELGPSMITRQLSTIYQDMIPEEQRRLYERYGSFFKEIIPDKLVVLSLNAMFFFKNNPVVDSCMSENDPGYQQLLWLGSVLHQFRTLGIKCWIISHVPVIQKNLEESCFLKLNLWIYEFRDVVIGNLMGHMNLDYFNIVKGSDLRYRLKHINSASRAEPKVGEADLEDDLFLGKGAAPVNKNAYMKRIKKEYKLLSKGLNLKKVDKLQENYHVVNVAGSIIPTFNPAFRIWSYNISDSSLAAEGNVIMNWKLFFEDLEQHIDDEIDLKNTNSIEALKKKKRDKTIPKKKPTNLLLGPGFENQFGSPLSFVQYYLDLNKLNRDFEKASKKSDKTEEDIIQKVFKYKVEYTSDELLELVHVEAEDFTVKTYLKIMNGLIAKKKTWRNFLKWVYVSTGYESL